MSIEKMKRNYFKSRFVITVAVTIAVVAAIILANVFVIKLAEKKSTIVDLTTYKSNSLSPENLEFIKCDLFRRQSRHLPQGGGFD